MAKLYAHVLNGKTVGVELNNYAIIDTPFVIKNSLDPAPLGYADISSISNWWNYAEGLRDYLFIRTEIKRLVEQFGIEDCLQILSDPPLNPNDGDKFYVDINNTATGDWLQYEGWIAIWNGISSEWRFEPAEWVGYRTLAPSEKKIAAQLKIGSQADHFVDYGIPDIVNYGFSYHKNARAAREDRMLRAVVEVYNIVPLNVGEALGNITASPLGDMYFRYMEFGVKGTLEDYNKDFNPNPTPGIIDWILSRAPFNSQEPYSSAGYPSGLTQKSWTPIDGQTIFQFADKLYEILVNGANI